MNTIKETQDATLLSQINEARTMYLAAKAQRPTKLWMSRSALRRLASEMLITEPDLEMKDQLRDLIHVLDDHKKGGFNSPLVSNIKMFGMEINLTGVPFSLVYVS